MNPLNVLILPDWEGCGPDHWQALWARRHGYAPVDQHDWSRPLRGDWLARLEDAVLTRDKPCVLVAHGLGCILAAAWSARSRHTHRVRAALLAAPTDVEQPQWRERLPTWAPVDLEALAFPSVLVASSDDPRCSLERARLFAHAWGAQFIDGGPAGHIDTASALASWPEGHVLLQDLMKD